MFYYVVGVFFCLVFVFVETKKTGLSCLDHCLDHTNVRRLGRIVEALLSMSGRVTMLGLSRWTERGGSYRTVQRFFNTTLAWAQVHWLVIRHHLLDREGVMLLAGDEVVVTKSGKQTAGLDRFFSSLECDRQLI